MGKSWIRKQLAAGLAALEQHPKKPLKKAVLELNEHIDQKNWKKAAESAKTVHRHLPKQSLWRRSLMFALTLAIAIFIAALVRQTWFELYEVPTGSMRPTIKEKDCVLVSKSAFGLNIPFKTEHVSFSKDHVKRGRIIVITADNLDIPDVDALYFKLFPGKKRYVKRLAALPNDTVYFYGGNLFILTPEQELIDLQSQSPLQDREYLPFISSFEGRVEQTSPSPFSRKKTFLLKHLNTPIGKIAFSSNGKVSSTINVNGKWIPEFSSPNAPRALGEFWGISNIATCRLLTPQQLSKEAIKLRYNDDEALLWLEMHHSPTLLQEDDIRKGNLHLVQTCKTWIPLHDEHIERLNKGLYSARLVIRNNRLRRYYFEGHEGSGIPLPKSIPDGTYEFYSGKAMKIGFGGTATELPDTHPIYPHSATELAFWFNVGIDVQDSSQQMPTRFAYFKNGNLWAMNTKIIEENEQPLALFSQKEIERQATDQTYHAFQDQGPPDTDLIKQCGFTIPENHYLLLGDNPAMSVDSRFFGPVPEQNIEGTPLLLYWPFGSRWGTLPQSKSPICIYSILFSCLALTGFTLHSRWQKRRTADRLARLKKSRKEKETS